MARSWNTIGKTVKGSPVSVIAEYYDDTLKIMLGQDIVAVELDTKTTNNLLRFLRDCWNGASEILKEKRGTGYE